MKEKVGEKELPQITILILKTPHITLNHLKIEKLVPIMTLTLYINLKLLQLFLIIFKEYIVKHLVFKTLVVLNIFILKYFSLQFFRILIHNFQDILVCSFIVKTDTIISNVSTKFQVKLP